jgi:hypothetical protein
MFSDDQVIFTQDEDDMIYMIITFVSIYEHGWIVAVHSGMCDTKYRTVKHHYGL